MDIGVEQANGRQGFVLLQRRDGDDLAQIFGAVGLDQAPVDTQPAIGVGKAALGFLAGLGFGQARGLGVARDCRAGQRAGQGEVGGRKRRAVGDRHGEGRGDVEGPAGQLVGELELRQVRVRCRPAQGAIAVAERCRFGGRSGMSAEHGQDGQ